MVRARFAAVRTGVGKAALLSTLPKGGSRRPSMERPARRSQRSSPRRADEGRTQSRMRRADERTRTAYPCSLRVITQALQGCAGVCNCRISKPLSFLCLAVCCTVLRSRWCQSGVNFTSHLLGQWVPRVGSTAFFARHPRPLSPCSLQPLASPLDASVAKCRGFSDGLGLGMIPRPRCDPLWVRRGCLVHPRI